MLTTNTKEKPVDVYKIYKYQPGIEKRHALLKSTLEVAPIWLKKNTRTEALMFLEFIAQIIAALREDPIHGSRSRNVCRIGADIQARHTLDDAREGRVCRRLAAVNGLELLDRVPLNLKRDHGAE
jgi:hypothetical protein